MQREIQGDTSKEKQIACQKNQQKTGRSDCSHCHNRTFIQAYNNTIYQICSYDLPKIEEYFK